MAEVFRGSWTLTVIARNASFDQRLRIVGSSNADGIYPASAGFSITVEGRSPWTVSIENNPGTGFRPSLTRRGVTAAFIQSGAIGLTIESEDSEGGSGDFDDLVLGVAHFGPVFEIPFRPYSLRPADLIMLPDGIFEATLGLQYMAVRVVNIWGVNYVDKTALTISSTSRAELASLGIAVIDTWSLQEQEALGQTVKDGKVILGPLPVFAGRTIYFKLNCSSSAARKPTVDFEWIGSVEEPPDTNSPNPKRHVGKKIFVSRSFYDAATGEMVTEVPEGRIRIKLSQFFVDVKSMSSARQRANNCRRVSRPKATLTPNEARKALKKLLRGNGGGTAGGLSFEKLWAASPLIKFLSTVAGSTVSVPVPPPMPEQGICSGRFRYKEFFAWPKAFEARLEMTPFEGVFSPIPFEDPWWKVALAIAAFILLAAALASAAADLAFQDDDLIIGKLKRTQGDDVDAAVVLLDDSMRDMVLKYLDVQSGDLNNSDPIDNLNGLIMIPRLTPFTCMGGTGTAAIEYMSNSEIMARIMDPTADNSVFKSGARTGLTHAIMYALCCPQTRTNDDGTITTFSIPQILFKADLKKQTILDRGDSGSVWIHTCSKKVVGLLHSGDFKNNIAIASPIQDVLRTMNIRLMK